jgi:vacuolar-type H+-ATPase subunit I/STV1
MRALGGKRAFMARLDAVEEQINRHTQETDEKLQRLKETLQKRQAAEERAKDRVQKWQRKMHDAAWYDVMRQLNKTNNEADQVVSAIARGLLLDESFLDEETKMILKERMGIDLAALRKKHDDDSDEAQKEIEWAIKGFFAKSADSMLGFITRMEAVKKLRAQMGVYE